MEQALYNFQNAILYIFLLANELLLKSLFMLSRDNVLSMHIRHSMNMKSAYCTTRAFIGFSYGQAADGEYTINALCLQVLNEKKFF